MKSVISDSVITCDEFIDTPENVAINAINKKLKMLLIKMLLIKNYFIFCFILLVNFYLLLTATI